MKAVWGLDYDYRTDKCFNRPICPECDAPVVKFRDGRYKCVSCRKPVDIDDAKMIEWLTVREETKITMEDCPKIEHDGFVHGCGGKACVETHHVRNDVTLEWQVAWGQCLNCKMRFIV